MEKNNFDPIWSNPKNNQPDVIVSKNPTTRKTINVEMSTNVTPVEKKTKVDDTKKPHKEIGRRIAVLIIAASLAVGLSYGAYKGVSALAEQYEKVNVDQELAETFRPYTSKKSAQEAGTYWYDFDETAKFVKEQIDMQSPYQLDNLLYGLYKGYGEYLPEAQIKELFSKLYYKLDLPTSRFEDYVKEKGYKDMEEFLEKVGAETRKLYQEVGDPGAILSQVDFGGR